MLNISDLQILKGEDTKGATVPLCYTSYLAVYTTFNLGFLCWCRVAEGREGRRGEKRRAGEEKKKRKNEGEEKEGEEKEKRSEEKAFIIIVQL